MSANVALFGSGYTAKAICMLLGMCLERAVSHHELRRGEARLCLDGELVAPVFQVAHCHCCGCRERDVLIVWVVDLL